MQPDVGVGIIGTGFGALVQLPGFLAVPGARVIGIASKDPARSAELTAAHGLPQAFDSAEALIAHPLVQLVSIATTPLEHAELTKKAIAAGKHVLCEKPFTFHGAQAQELLTLAQSAGIVHGVDFEFRELPAMQLLHAQVPSIGTLQSATLRWEVGTWADEKRAWRWQCDRAQGGGILGALGVHLFDAAEWLCGPMGSIRAQLETKITSRPDDAGKPKAVTSEDTASIDMQTVSDVPVSIRLSNVNAQGDGLTIELRGDKGTLTLQSLSQDYASGLRVSRDGTILLEDQPQTTGDPRIRPFQVLAARFIQAIQSRGSFAPSFVEGLRSDVLYEAAWKSHEKGGDGWVDIL